MRLGVDCDGVLTDMSAYLAAYGEKRFGRRPVNPDAYTLSEMFGCGISRKESLRCYRKYCRKCPPRMDSAAVLQKLKTEGFDVYEITSRKFSAAGGFREIISRFLLKRWNRKNRISFAETVFCSECDTANDKLNACLRRNIGVMIDDNPEVAGLLSAQGIRVLLFDAPYNRAVSGRNIFRVYSWPEIYRFVSGPNAVVPDGDSSGRHDKP